MRRLIITIDTNAAIDPGTLDLGNLKRLMAEAVSATIQVVRVPNASESVASKSTSNYARLLLLQQDFPKLVIEQVTRANGSRDGRINVIGTLAKLKISMEELMDPASNWHPESLEARVKKSVEAQNRHAARQREHIAEQEQEQQETPTGDHDEQ